MSQDDIPEIPEMTTLEEEVEERLVFISRGGSYQQWLAKSYPALRRKRFYSDRHAKAYIESTGKVIPVGDAMDNSEYFWTVVYLYNINKDIFENPLLETRFLAAILLNAYRQQISLIQVPYEPDVQTYGEESESEKENKRLQDEKRNEEIVIKHFLTNPERFFRTYSVRFESTKTVAKLGELLTIATTDPDDFLSDKAQEALDSYKQDLLANGIKDDCFKSFIDAWKGCINLGGKVPPKKFGLTNGSKEFSSDDDYY